jgi:hypothetical protein
VRVMMMAVMNMKLHVHKTTSGCFPGQQLFGLRVNGFFDAGHSNFT